MTSQIDLTDKTERDILMLLVERVNGINERLDKLNGIIAAHETRLRGLEDWRNIIVGGLGVLTLLTVAVIVPLLMRYWK